MREALFPPRGGIRQFTSLVKVPPKHFASINQNGVGQLAKIACKKGNQTRPVIKLGPAKYVTANTAAAPIPSSSATRWA